MVVDAGDAGAGDGAGAQELMVRPSPLNCRRRRGLQHGHGLRRFTCFDGHRRDPGGVLLPCTALQSSSLLFSSIRMLCSRADEAAPGTGDDYPHMLAHSTHASSAELIRNVAARRGATGGEGRRGVATFPSAAPKIVGSGAVVTCADGSWGVNVGNAGKNGVALAPFAQ